jgi:hypothetical protein
MPTYLYCVLPRGDGDEPAAASVRGIADMTVRALPVGALEAWVSTIATWGPAATVDAVKQHDRVVAAALATGRTPLPARFGQSWPSDDACVASITDRTGELEPLLRRVAGLVEMTVCTLLPGMPPAVRARGATTDDAAPGRAYLDALRARADRERRLRVALEALRSRVREALGPLARDEVAEIRGSDKALALSVSYLVERERESQFRRAIEDVARDAAARLVVAGPRAPYSFAPTARQSRTWTRGAAGDSTMDG